MSTKLAVGAPQLRGIVYAYHHAVQGSNPKHMYGTGPSRAHIIQIGTGTIRPVMIWPVSLRHTYVGNYFIELGLVAGICRIAADSTNAEIKNIQISLQKFN